MQKGKFGTRMFFFPVSPKITHHSFITPLEGTHFHYCTIKNSMKNVLLFPKESPDLFADLFDPAPKNNNMEIIQMK